MYTILKRLSDSQLPSDEEPLCPERGLLWNEKRGVI